MKTKNQLTNRILSLVLVFVLVLGMVPTVAFAAEPVEAQEYPNIPNNSTPFPYGSYFYFTANNCLYSIYMYNLKADSGITHIKLYTQSGGMVFIAQQNGKWDDGRYRSINANNDSMTPYPLSNLPKSAGESVELHYNSNYEEIIWGPSFTVTCLAVGSPEWAWNGTTATARFLSADGKAAVTRTVNGQLTSTTPAENCLQNVVRNYSATVTLNGKSYVGYKQVSGEAGPHSYTKETVADNYLKSAATCTAAAVYYKSCEYCGTSSNSDDATFTYGSAPGHTLRYEVKENTTNVLVETCANGCGHQAIASIVAGEAIYTGSEITDAATISYDSGTWVGDKPVLSFENNVNVGTATAKMTAGDATASTTFKINPASLSYATVTLDPENGTYNGSAYAPAITVIFNGATLVKDRDYTRSWDKSGFTNADTYTVRVVGINNFTGYLDKTFNINAANLADVKVEQVGTLTYTGEALTPAVSANAVAVNNQPITFTYSTESEGPYSTEIPSFTNAGWAHTVYYIATADNHNTYYGSFLVEIEKATVIEPTIATKPYTGSEQTADVTDTDLYTVVKNEGGTGVKENGCYDVVLELKDSANYKWSTTDNPQVTLQFKITRAENEWTVDPSITGWTYGEAAKAPVGEAKFGGVSVGYSGTTNGGAAYNGVAAPTEAGSYTATFIVQETEDYKGLETSVDFTIAKADQAAPTGLTKTDTTYFGKADGKISGLTSAMEFRKEEDSAYTAGFNGTLEYLAAGTYYVRYQGDANHNPSPDAVVTVNAGRKLQIVVPQNQVGYTVTVNKTEMEYEGSYTLKVEIHEGYTATEDFKIIISNWECGQQAGVEETYMNAIADQIIEVRGVADITPPAAEIKVKENKWTSFWNNLTFGLFFKETQDVTITTTDKGSGVKSIQYYLFDRELERDEVRSITDWIDYNGIFKIDPDNRYVIYVKVTDNAGNAEYINSEGIVLDATAPVLYGIENGGVYHGDKVFKATDENFLKIEVNGVDITDTTEGDAEFKIAADNAEHIVTVTDRAGNVTEYKVTVYKNYTVTYKADGEPISTETVGHGKDANLPVVPAKNGYVGKWDSDGKNITGDTTITVVYTEIPVVKPNEVKPENKTDLEDTKKQLEDMLKDDSYTDEGKKNIQDAIDDIDDALEVIGNVEAVEESIVKLPAVDTVKPDDEEAIKAITDAQTAYNALSAHEKSLVDEATKANLDKLVAALVAYDIVEGDGSSWTEDSNHNITFVVNGLFSKFVGIKVDGKDVDKANYEVKAGSTIITLKASYLDTLAVGEHTITVVYTDGSTDGTFNVHAKANSPATGDNSHMFLWIALLFISGGAVITLTVVERKKRSAAKR